MVANLAEAQTHPISPEDFLQHDRAVRIAEREAEDASAALARAKKAKNGAVDLEAYKLIEKLRKLDDDEQIIVLRHVIQYASWLEMPIGAQLSMLDAPQIDKPKAKAAQEYKNWAAGEAGLKAGRKGVDRDENPYPPGTELWQAWDSQWLEGARENNTAEQMAENAKNDAPVLDKPKRGRPRKSATAALANARSHLSGNGATAH